MNSRTLCVAAFLLLSGNCALIYQTVWLRTFRLIFGASTPAAAAVLAIFMGGLGLGSIKLGRWAQEHQNPLRLYARLELGIAFSAAVSPFLLDQVRDIYLSLGGSLTLGGLGATLVRLALAPLVIGVPVFLMGGTLPAAARAVTTVDDLGRRGLGLLYGLNALGAVGGVLLATFFLFELMGLRDTLWCACALNALVGLAALYLSRLDGPRAEPVETAPVVRVDAGEPATSVPRRWILLAAFATGFSFLLAELVWFRLSAPILGGTTYSFGLILAYALAGIGLGGVLYAWWGKATPGLFGVTCALEALLLLVPYVLGDDLAWLTLYLRGFAARGFGALVMTWGVVAGIMVFPPAIVAGFQFPLLLGLKGRGREDVAVDVGEVFAANTLGAIGGSLAGGFGLLPLLTAPGAWKLAAICLLPVALPFAQRGRRLRFGFAALACLCGACLFAEGPSAIWRHTGIGAGRNNAAKLKTSNQLRRFEAEVKRTLHSEYEGRESSIGVMAGDGLVFFTNGKSDGHVIKDAPTAVNLGLIGAITHRKPERAFVIGLGGGQTAGWLAEVPSMQHVEVAELEPAVLEFARTAAACNFDVMNHPRVRVSVADAREVLQTTSERYDLIASEPSNPYRAGIASLFSLDFYREARTRLRPGGLFLQWLQLYDVDSITLRMCLATLRSVFADVSVWLLNAGREVLLMSSDSPQVFDVQQVRRRLAQAPYRAAFGRICGIYDVEGLLASYVANDLLAQQALRLGGERLNTDDRLRLEYRFSRLVGSQQGITAFHLLGLAGESTSLRPSVIGRVDWDRVDLLRTRSFQASGITMPPLAVRPEHAAQARFDQSMQDGSYEQAAALVGVLPAPPDHDLFERLQRMRALAWAPNHRIEDSAAFERELTALAAGGLAADVAWLRVSFAMLRPEAHSRLSGDVAEACRLTRIDPLVNDARLAEVLKALPAHVHEPDLARQLARSLADGPFVVFVEEEVRRVAAANLATTAGDMNLVTKLFEEIEPHAFWRENALRLRLKAYEATGSRFTERARSDLERFRRAEAVSLRQAFGGR